MQKKQDTWVWSLSQEDPLEKGMATHPVFMPGESSWTKEPGGLQSMGLQRIGHNWATNTFHFYMSWESSWGNEDPKKPLNLCIFTPGLVQSWEDMYGKGYEISMYNKPGENLQVLFVWVLLSLLIFEDKGAPFLRYWVGQKVCLSFSITSYRKTQTNFSANQ